MLFWILPTFGVVVSVLLPRAAPRIRARRQDLDRFLTAQHADHDVIAARLDAAEAAHARRRMLHDSVQSLTADRHRAAGLGRYADVRRLDAELDTVQMEIDRQRQTARDALVDVDAVMTVAGARRLLFDATSERA